MAEFNPSAGKPQATPNFTGSSRGIDADRQRPDTSVADLFEGLGTGVVQGIAAIDQGIQEEIKSELYEGIDFINREFGIDDAAIAESFSGDVFGDRPVPGQLRDASRNLANLQLQVQQGALKESHYWARAQSLLRQVRGRYPGYREEIDTMIRNITGSDPANALRRNKMNEWDADATKMSEAERRKQSFIQSNIETMVVASGEDFQNKDLDTLVKEQAIYRKRDAVLDRQEAELAQETRMGTRNKEKVRISLQTRFDTIVNTILSQGIEQADKQMSSPVKDQIAAALAKVQSGKSFSSEDARVLSAAFSSTRLKITEALSAAASKTWAESDDPSMTYNAVLDAADVKAAMERSLAQLDFMEEAITNERYGLLALPVAQLEAYKNDVTVSLLKEFDFSKVIAMSHGVGGEGMNALMSLLPKSTLAHLELVDSMFASEIQLGKLGEVTARQHVEKVQKATDVDDETAAKIIDNSLTRWENIINAIGTEQEVPEEMLLKEASYWFSPENYNLTTEAFKDDASKAAYFRRIASPKVSAAMEKLRDAGQVETWDMYQKWVANEFQVQFKQPMTVLSQRVRNPELFDVHWNPQLMRFDVAENPDMSAIAKNSIRYSGEVAEVEQAEAAMNDAIKIITPIIEANDRDVPTELLSLFMKMGYNPDAPPEEPTIATELGNALLRELKIVGEDIKKFKDFGTGMTLTEGDIAEQLPSVFLRLRDNMWDALTPFTAPFRAPEERGEIQGGQTRSLSDSTQQTSSPSNPALDKRLGELKNEYPQAVAALQNAPEPPNFDDLPWMHRFKIKSEASALGVTPQEVINRAHELVRPPKQEQHEVAEVPDDPIATYDYNSMLNLLGNAEGTDKGDSYNETLGYGAFTGGDVNLTEMTLDEVDSLQSTILKHPDNTHNASPVGRYQIVRKTLRTLRKKLGLSGSELYTPELQDRLALQLMKDRGLDKWRAGEITDKQFITNLAKEWASLPLPDSSQSAYGGRTRVSSTQVLVALAKIVDTHPEVLRQLTLPEGIRGMPVTMQLDLMEALNAVA